MIAEKLGIEVKDNISVGDILKELIVRTFQKYNQKVVILLDEYDKPYTDFVNDRDMADEVRLALRNYYTHIKASDEYIRFTFITGISKFAKFGVFSTLNTPLDISLMPDYAEMCGYTEEEIIQYFPDYLDETAREMQISTTELLDRMRYYYNGFSFDRNAAVRLYNPFSTLSFFREKDFANYWIESGRSKTIADYMKNHHLTVEEFRGLPVSKEFARSPGDVDKTTPEGFLYQNGYLTLRPGIHTDLTLDYPNTEVLNSMSDLLTKNILAENANTTQQDLLIALSCRDAGKVVETLNCLLARIPYDDFSNAAKQSLYRGRYKFPAQEWLYRSIIFAFMHGCGVVVNAEMHTNMGRADLVISYRGVIWVIEIKIAYEGQSAEQKAEEAGRQIKEKNYAAPYPDAVCLGLGIDDKARQITASFHM
jgi:hypothetical protein